MTYTNLAPTASVIPLDTLEAPIVAPEFLDTLHLQARQMLYDYLRMCGPVEVFELYRVTAGLECFNEDVKRNAGQVTRDSNLSITGLMTTAINSIAAMGGTFSDGFTCSIRRTPKLTASKKESKTK
jgi:hypothetical protein